MNVVSQCLFTQTSDTFDYHVLDVEELRSCSERGSNPEMGKNTTSVVQHVCPLLLATKLPS